MALSLLQLFLQQVTFDPDDIAKWSHQITEQQQHPADVAEAWVKTHPRLVEQWLADI